MNAKRPLILIIGDAPENIASYKRCLTRGPGIRYRVQVAGSGARALASSRRAAPDCALLDLRLPDMNALEVLQKLAGESGTLPFVVIALIEAGDTQLAEEAMRFGAHDFLEKSQITPDLLRRAIANAVEKAALRREIELQRAELAAKNLALERRLADLEREVAERKHAEEALRLANERFTLAEAVSNGYIYDWDPESGRVERSYKFNELFGYSDGEAAGTFDWWKDLVHPDDIGQVSATLEQRLRGQEPGKVDGYSFEYRARHKDGRYLWLWDRGKLMRDETGRVTRVVGSAVNITRRKQIENSLRESEEKFSKVFKASPHRITITTLDEGRYIDVNDAVLRATGYERQEMIGHTVEELRIFADPEGQDKLLKAFKDRSVRDLEIQLRSKNGEVRTVLMSAEIITINGQRCILTVSNDITERKRAEESLRESQERLNLAIEAAGMFIWETDIATGRIKSNFPELMMGMEPGAFGGTFDSFLSLVHPDDRESFLKIRNNALASNGSYDLEMRTLRPDGGVRWGLVRGTVYRDERGNPTRLVGVDLDITERKRMNEALRLSEERYRLLIRASSHVVITSDATGAELDSGADWWEQLTGQPKSESRNHGWTKRLHPDDYAATVATWQKAIADQQSFEAEFRVCARDGDYIWLHATGAPVRDANGNFREWAIALRDITERKQTEESLQRANRRYHFALDAVDGYVYEYNVADKTSERSHGLAKLMGFGVDEAPPQAAWWFDLIHPDDRDEVLSEIEKMLGEESAQTTYSFEYRVRHKDQSYIDVLDRGMIVRDAEGRPTQILGAIVNITERKRAEQSLRESEERMRHQNEELENIYQAAPVGLSLMDRDFRIVRINETMAEINGVTVGQALGRTVRELIPEAADRLEPIFNRVLRTGRPIMNLDIHGVTVREPGIERDWLASYYPIKDADGCAQGIGSIVLEITERKRAEAAVRESEERLRMAAQAANFGLYSLDAQTYENYWSPELKRIFGLPDEAPVPMDKLSDLIHPDDREEVMRAIEASLDPRGNGEFEMEHRALRPDGSVRWVLARGKTLFTGKGRKRKAARAIGVAFDITERKEAEERMRASEELFRTIFDLSGIGILQVEPSIGRFLRANREFCKWIGYSEAELLKMSFGEITHPGDREVKLGGAEKFLRGEMDEYYTEIRCVRKDGSVVWGLVTSRMLRDAAGRPLSTVTAAQDITERKRFEEALIESEERYRRLIETANEGIWLFDSDATTLYVNEAMANLLGYAAEEIARRKVSEFCFEQDMSKAVEYVNSNLKGNYLEYDFRFRRRDGGELHVLASTSPVYDARGAIVGAMGMFTDITERKRAEEALRESERRLKLSLAAGRAGTWEWRIKDNRLIWSDEYYDVFGLTPGDLESTLENFLLCIYPDDRDRMLAEMTEVLQERKDTEHEFRFIRPDGDVRWAQSKAHLTLDEAGEPERLIGILIDITERKQAEIEREGFLRKEREARAQAEAANRGKDEFVAMVSHELRSPLNAMLGWSKILKRGGVDLKTQAHAVEVIERSARAQQNIIEDLLDMTRIVGGKLRVEMHPVSLARVIEAATDVVRPAAMAREIDLRVSIKNADEVTGDADRLQQVVWNLLSNAVKFTPHGGRIEVILERTGPWAQITVADTGRGIKAEDLPFIFDRFRQAESSGAKRFAGLGLGLALVKHLVELHGGQVSAESVGEGRGASFTVKLPVRAVRGEAAPGRMGEWESGRVGEPGSGKRLDREVRGDVSYSPALPPSRPSILSLQGVWALIVDDEADARDLVATLLGQYGARVTAASCATEAFDKLRKGEAGNRPDVLVSDIGMPDEDGYMLIERVRRLSPEEGGKIPAIALTAFERQSDRIKALAAGFSMHVPKPVEPEELVMVIANLTGHPGKS